MTPRELEEYKELRATVRERGTARMWLVYSGLATWAGLTVATTALEAPPAATLVSLLVLATAFEIILSLQVGAERIGRYVQVFLEGEDSDGEGTAGLAVPGQPPATRGWEHHAMGYGRRFPGGGDPIFSVHFSAAAALNFVPPLAEHLLPVELVVIGGIHVLFAVRLLAARRQIVGQREEDLIRFRQLKQGRA